MKLFSKKEKTDNKVYPYSIVGGILIDIIKFIFNEFKDVFYIIKKKVNDRKNN